jgi:hypothetical protein
VSALELDSVGVFSNMEEALIMYFGNKESGW